MSENTSTGIIVHNLDAILLLRIKLDPILLYEVVDEPLEKFSACHLAGTAVVDVGNCTADASVKFEDKHSREWTTRNTQLFQAQGL